MKTRAAVATAANKPLEIMTLDLAPPGPGEVLVQMKAAGLCHSDLSMLEGKTPNYGFPIVLGHEGAGLVVECGPGVTSVQPGDHVVPVAIPECRECANCLSGKTNLCLQMFAPVPSPFSYDGHAVQSFCGTGTFAEYSVVREIQLSKVAGNAPDDILCYVGCGVVTGVGAALKTARVAPGSSVAVFGLGGIGLNALQGSRIAGASTIIGVDINPAREEIARQFGATHFVNPKDCDVVPRIRELTGGGVDFSFECVGRLELMQAALDCSNPGFGVAVSVGVAPGGAKLEIDPMAVLTGRSWKGSLLGGEKARTTVPILVDWYQSGFLKLDELVTHRLPLDEINRGFDMMKSGEAIRSVVLY